MPTSTSWPVTTLPWHPTGPTEATATSEQVLKKSEYLTKSWVSPKGRRGATRGKKEWGGTRCEVGHDR